MRTTKTLKPEQKGTEELLTRFGPSLLYVRYRYDEERREHVKTVELIVQRRSREGRACSGSKVPGARRAPAVGVRQLALRIGRRERDLQRRVKSAGGRRNPHRRV